LVCGLKDCRAQAVSGESVII